MADPPADTAAGSGRSRTIVVLEVVGWIVLLGGVLLAWLGIAVDNHFACGGTLGGYGESATARLDEACVDARSWRFAVPPAIYAGALALRVWIPRRKRSRSRS